MPARFQIRELTSAPRLQKPGRLLRLMNVYQRCDDMLMFCVIATALLMSMALLPAYGAAITPAETTNAKSDRLSSDPVVRACSGQGWGNETVECLVAITRDGGRDEVRAIRVVVAEPDSTRPNIF